MARTLEECRAELAGAVGRFITGICDAGAANDEVIDAEGLGHLTEDDALIGGLAYIRTAGGAAPEGEDRRIVDYDAATGTITVEYDWGAATAAADVYEVYKAPLMLEDWDGAINAAISGAWPEVWERGVYVVEDLTRWPVFAMPAAAEEVLEVWLVPWSGVGPGDDAGDPAQWIKWDRGFRAQRVPPAGWRQEGTPGTDLNLRVMGRAAPDGFQLQVIYKGRYAELGEAESTALDWAYLLAAARAEFYARLSDAGSMQADRSALLQLMNHWQEAAQARKEALGRVLVGIEMGSR